MDIVPAHKKIPKTDKTNYRPVSILSNYFGLYEKLMHKQLHFPHFETIRDKVFNSGLSKFCGRHPLKNLLSPLLNTFFHIVFKPMWISKKIIVHNIAFL